MNDRHVDDADDREDRAHAVGLVAVLERGAQREIAQEQEQQQRLGHDPRVSPLPERAPCRPTPDRAGREGAGGERRADRCRGDGHRVRKLDAPNEADARGHRHHDVRHHADVGDLRMKKEDSIDLALHAIGRRDGEPPIRADGQQDDRDRAEPGHQPAREPVNERRRAEQVEPTRQTHSFPYSTPTLNAAPIASGPSASANAANAASKYSGPAGRLVVQAEVGGPRTEDQERSGQRQYEQADDRSAAAQAHRQCRAERDQHAQRRSREHEGSDHGRQRRERHRIRQREDRDQRDQRQDRHQPVRRDLRENGDADRHRAQHELLEAAVVRIAAKQALPTRATRIAAWIPTKHRRRPRAARRRSATERAETASRRSGKTAADLRPHSARRIAIRMSRRTIAENADTAQSSTTSAPFSASSSG